MSGRVLDPDDFYDLTTVTGLSVSPDGERVAFVADEFLSETDEQQSSLYVVPSNGRSDPHRLTHASGGEDPKWSPTGDRLGFLASRDRDVEFRVGTDGSEDCKVSTDADNRRPQVWIFDMERGGDARQVTDRDEGVRSFDWAPDGERLVIESREPSDDQRDYLKKRREENAPVEIQRLQHKYDGRGWLDEVPTYLFIVDVASRETERLDDAWDRSLPSVDGGLQPRWGQELIAFRASPNRSDDSYAADLYTIAPDGDDLLRRTNGDLMVSAPRWGPGGRIAFVGQNPENWHDPSQVYILGDDDYTSVSSVLDRTVAPNASPVWVNDETLVVRIGDEGCTRLVRLHVDGTPPSRTFDAQGRNRTMTCFDLGGGTGACCLSTPADGADLFAVNADDLDETSPERLTRVNENILGDVELPECNRVSFESDGTTVEGLAYLPTGFDREDPDPRPLLLKIHGGPVAYDSPEFSFETSYWTGRGYIVLNVNYRGSSSYGREFSEVIRSDWGSRETADVIAAAQHLVELGWTTDRLFVTGFSYGGMTTAHVLATTDIFAAGVAEHGVYDYRSAFGTDDSHVWWENDFGVPWEHTDRYDRSSSITAVSKIETPLLVTAGGEDERCPPSQAEQLYVSVRKRGVDAKLVIYPDEHHDIGDPDRAIHRLEQIKTWFESHDPAEKR